MPTRSRGNAGKTILMLAGGAYGLYLGMHGGPHGRRRAGSCALENKVDDLEVAVEKLRDSTVSQDRLTQAVHRTTSAITVELDRKFQMQSIAVGSLRDMVAQTDLLLIRVLDQLDTIQRWRGDEESDAVRT